MNRFAVVLAVFTILALIAKGEDPVMPRRKVCSIQGKGKVEYLYRETTYEGAFIMYRVNGAVLYSFNASNDAAQPDKVEGLFIIRKDIKENQFGVRYNPVNGSSGHGVSSDDTYPLASYSYNKNWKHIPDGDYYCFLYRHRDAAMLFTPDEKMDLIAEWYLFSSPNYPGEVTFLYDEVKEFEHNEVDDLFSTDLFADERFLTKAATALTSLCDSVESSTAHSSTSKTTKIIPSLLAFVVLIMASAFSFH